jgi:hypothetical protein
MKNVLCGGPQAFDSDDLRRRISKFVTAVEKRPLSEEYPERPLHLVSTMRERAISAAVVVGLIDGVRCRGRCQPAVVVFHD